jgi:hypothetical protein
MRGEHAVGARTPARQKLAATLVYNDRRKWYALGESNPSLHRERVPS